MLRLSKKVAMKDRAGLQASDDMRDQRRRLSGDVWIALLERGKPSTWTRWMRGGSGSPECITAIKDGLSDGIVALKRGNSRGAKAISQCNPMST